MKEYQEEIRKITKSLPYDPRILYKLLQQLHSEDDQSHINVNYKKICDNLQHCERLQMRILENAKKILFEKHTDRLMKNESISLVTIMSLLGYETIKELLYRASMEILIDHLYEEDNIKWNFYKVQSIATGVAAEVLFEEFQLLIKGGYSKFDFYSAGLFSNIGRIAFNTWKKREYYERVEKKLDLSLPESNRVKLELNNYHVTHSILGSEMAKAWGLPKFYEKAALLHDNIRQLEVEPIEIQIIILANLIAFIAMPMVKYPEDTVYIDFLKERKRFVRKLEYYFLKLENIAKTDFYKNLDKNIISIIETVHNKSLKILNNYSIPPAGGMDPRIRRLQSRIIEIASSFKGMRANIEDEDEETVDISKAIFNVPLEISFLFSKYDSEFNLDKKYDIYREIIFWCMLLLQSVILSTVYNQEDKDFYRKILKNKISSLYGYSFFLKILTINHSKINIFKIDKTALENISFYDSKLKDKSIRSNRMIFTNVLSKALENIINIMEGFEKIDMFEVLDMDVSDNEDELIYNIRYWDTKSSSGYDGIDNYDTLRTKKMVSKGKFCIKARSSLYSSFPFIVISDQNETKTRTPYLFYDIEPETNTVIYVRKNIENEKINELRIEYQEDKFFRYFEFLSGGVI